MQTVVVALLELWLTVSAAVLVWGVSFTPLSHSTILDADNNYHLAWTFDDQHITFQVSVKTRGYIGLGFSPNGGMAGSDIVIGWVDDSTGEGEISDRHAVDRSEPLSSETQDYTLLHSYQNETHTVVRFRRKLDLCGDQDYHIKDETVRIIWAYHDADPTPEGSIQYHRANRGNKNMYLLNPQRPIRVLPANVIYEEFLNRNVTIPAVKTTYWCEAFPVPRLDRKHHVIKIEPIIQPGRESEVHHMLLWACYHPVSSQSFYKSHICYHPNMPDDFNGCWTPMVVWTIGGGSQYFPENVGLPLGHEDSPTMFLMETHYDNPTERAGLLDSSGLRLTITPEIREYDAGILEIGEDVGRTQIIPPFSEHFRTSGHCFPECLSQAMGTQPQRTKAFGGILHTHFQGRAIRVRHFRQGMEQPVLMKDNNYDFNYQDLRVLKNEVEIHSGDHFVVECDYETKSRNKITYGGISTRDEMCLAFIYHYPAIKLGLCMSTPSPQYQATFLNLSISDNQTITSPEKYVGRSLYDVLEMEVHWSNKTNRDSYEQLISAEGVNGFRARCIQGKVGYPVHGQVLALPRKITTLPVTLQTCSGVRVQLTRLLFLLGVIAILGV